MSASTDQPQPADYGIDAPAVVRNLFLAAGADFLIWGSAALGLWSGRLVIPIPYVNLVFPLEGMGFGFGVGFTLMGVWMIYGSKVGRLRSREQLLQQITWSGNERVLDVGCSARFDAYRSRQTSIHRHGQRHRFMAGGRPFG